MKQLRAVTLPLLAFLAMSVWPPQAVPQPAPKPGPEPTLTLVAPDTVAPGDMATITIDPSSTAQDIVWDVGPVPTNPANWCGKDGSNFANLCSGSQGGTFTVFAAGNMNGKTVKASVTITFGNPPPPPPPPTVISKLWIITLTDTASQTDQQNKLLANAPYWQSVAVAGHKFRDFDSKKAENAAWLKLLPSGVSPPAVIFQDQDTKKVVEVDALPADEAGMSAIIKRITGKSPN